jgi:NAD(P)H dehydrogenase (quinone)
MIFVTGANGVVGGAVLARLASLGRNVAAMARRPEAARLSTPGGIAVRVANYDDPPALRRAFSGVEDLVLISSDGTAAAVTRHHANAIAAAADAGVRHVVFTSIVDVATRSPFYFSPVYRNAERRLRSCGITSTIVRCGLYSDFIVKHWLQPAAAELRLPAGGGRIAPISRADVAAAVTAVVVNRDHRGRIHTITGPAALTLGELAHCYGDAIGLPVRYRPCSADAYRASAATHLDEPWPEAFATLCAAIAQERWESHSDFADLVGRQAETFKDFVLRAVAAPRPSLSPASD